MSTKTRTRHEIPWRALALGQRAGNPDAARLADWAEIREQEDARQPQLVRKAVVSLHAAFGEWCATFGKEKSDALRYAECARILNLANPVPTCNALPIAQLLACARRFREEVQQQGERANLLSLETTAPPVRWAGDAA